MTTLQDRHPEMYRPRNETVPRGTKREVPMEALSFGHIRTGTATMSTALTMHGLKCYHSLLWFSTNAGDLDLVNEALDAKFFHRGKPYTREDFDQIFHDFGAVCEIPTLAFVPELLEAYPEAKVILVERDVNSWYDSIERAIIPNVYSPVTRFISKIDPWYVGPLGKTYDRFYHGWMEVHTKHEMRAKAKEQYLAHNALVKKLTPPDRLLLYNLEDGWEPLCSHLGKPVPKAPFPRLNETEWLNEKMNVMAVQRVKAVGWEVLKYAVPLVVAVAGYVACTRM